MDRPFSIAAAPGFVGREQELSLLSASLDAAREGRASIALVSGDPGIGKTRLAHELVAMAEQRGMQVCFGRFVESGPIPFRAFTTALIPQMERAGLLTGDVLGPSGAVLKSLVSSAGLTTGHEGERDDARLYQSLARGTIELAARRPMLLVIDDLQWAEPNALDAFVHLVMAASDALVGSPLALMILALHRPPDTDAFAEQVARLRRESIVASISLDGLPELDLHELVRMASSVQPSPPLLGALERSTQGNPLFVLESLRTLAQQGALEVRDGQLEARTATDRVVLPSDVTRVIAGRLALLPDAVREVLSTASLMADEFSLASLAVATGEPEDALLDHLDLAARERFVVEVEASVFAFNHALVRKVVQSALSESRRRRRHAAIAARLIAAHGEAESHVIEVAQHLVLGGGVEDELATGRYSVRAAEKSFAAHSWGETARFFESALASPPFVASLDSAARARLLVEAARAHYRNWDIARADARFQEAIGAFRALGDIDGWGLALEHRISIRVNHVDELGPLDEGAYEEFLEASLGKHLSARAVVMTKWSELLYRAREAEGAMAAAREALQIGEDIDSAYIRIHARLALGLAAMLALDLELAEASFRDARNDGRMVDDPWFQAMPLMNLPLVVLMRGRPREAAALAAEAAEEFGRLHNWASVSFVLATQAMVASVRGDQAEAERNAAEAAKYARRARYRWSMPVAYYAVLPGRIESREWAVARDGIAALAEAGARRPARDLGLLADALESGATPPVAPHAGPRCDLFDLAAACVQVDLARVTGQPGLGSTASPLLKRALDSGMVFAPGPAALLSRLHAQATLDGGDPRTAAALFQQAIVDGLRVGAPREVAQARLCWAETVVAHSLDHSPHEVIEAVRRAETSLRELEMTISADAAAALIARLDPREARSRSAQRFTPMELDIMAALGQGAGVSTIADRLLISERTAQDYITRLGRRGITGAETANSTLANLGLTQAAEDGASRPLSRLANRVYRAFMFTDIVDHARLNRTVGDTVWLGILDQHNAAIEAAVAAAGGTIVKYIGDAVFATFLTTEAAVDCARSVKAAFPMSFPALTRDVVDIRIGLHAGEAMQVEHDLLGHAVSLAHRLASMTGNRVLVTSAIRDAADGLDHTFALVEEAQIKGYDEPIAVFELLAPATAVVASGSENKLTLTP